MTNLPCGFQQQAHLLMDLAPGTPTCRPWHQVHSPSSWPLPTNHSPAELRTRSTHSTSLPIVPGIYFQRLCYIHPMEYYLALRKQKILPFATTQINQEMIMLSEIIQAWKQKYYMMPLTYEDSKVTFIEVVSRMIVVSM